MTTAAVVAAIVAVLLASYWAERAHDDEPRRGVPVTVQAGLVAVCGAALTAGLWLVLRPVAVAWIGHGGPWMALGVVMLLAISVPLIPAGLAVMFLVISPLVGLSVRSQRRRLQRMREAARAAATSLPIHHISIEDHAGVRMDPPPRQIALVVVSDDRRVSDDPRVTSELETLRATIDRLRRHRHPPLALRIEAPDADDPRRSESERQVLYQRES